MVRARLLARCGAEVEEADDDEVDASAGNAPWLLKPPWLLPPFDWVWFFFLAS